MEMAPQAIEKIDSGDGNGGAIRGRRTSMKGRRDRTDEATSFGA
jgi:hypothetical protein